MTNNSLELPTLESRLTAIKSEIDKELILLGSNLGEDDDGLIAALENLSEKIVIYLKNHTSDSALAEK